jgi:replicative DNA helicase
VSDLRGSGAIEEDAAAVMLLYEDKADRERALADMTYVRGPVKSWLKIGKNRYGLQGAYMALAHYKNWTRFDPPEEPIKNPVHREGVLCQRQNDPFRLACEVTQ